MTKKFLRDTWAQVRSSGDIVHVQVWEEDGKEVVWLDNNWYPIEDFEV